MHHVFSPPDAFPMCCTRNTIVWKINQTCVRPFRCLLCRSLYLVTFKCQAVWCWSSFKFWENCCLKENAKVNKINFYAFHMVNQFFSVSNQTFNPQVVLNIFHPLSKENKPANLLLALSPVLHNNIETLMTLFHYKWKGQLFAEYQQDFDSCSGTSYHLGEALHIKRSRDTGAHFHASPYVLNFKKSLTLWP